MESKEPDQSKIFISKLVEDPFKSGIFPGAICLKDLSLPGKEFFENGKPKGLVVHYTADRNIDRVIRSLNQSDLGYHLFIDRKGTIIQQTYLTMKTFHAGRAKWRGHSPNQDFIGIALLNWGILQTDELGNFQTWAGTSVDPAEVVANKNNIEGDHNDYYWDAATPEQVTKLIEIALYFMMKGINVNNICGHDECAIPVGRKIDPGGILPFTMRDFRTVLNTCHDKYLREKYGMETKKDDKK